MSCVPSIKKVRFASFIDIRYYDADEAIYASAEEEEEDQDEVTYTSVEEEDEEVFYDSLEEQKTGDAEGVLVALEAKNQSVLSAPSLAVVRAPKRPLEADDNEATPKHESKRLHIDEACSSLSGGAPFAVYEDAPVPVGPFADENAPRRQRNNENDVSGLCASSPPPTPSPGLRVRRPLGLKFTSFR